MPPISARNKARRRVRAPVVLSRDALHAYFWRKSNVRHRLPIHTRELAEDLGVDRCGVKRVVREMYRSGRMRKVAHLPNGPDVYEVADPATWDPDDPTTHARAHETHQWG